MRKYYLDNIRWVIILLVLVEHVVSVFNSCGAVVSYNAPGIPALDTVGYMIYPWFMPCLFVVAGMSARYSLQRRSAKEFWKERVWKLLIPFLSYMLVFGPPTSYISIRSLHMEEIFTGLPQPVVFVIKVLNGMGPAWFLPQLLLVSLLFLLILRLDKSGKLLELGSKCSPGILLLLYVPLLAAAQVLEVAHTFRNAFYLLLFLIGYYILSHESIQEFLKKYSVLFLVTGLLLGVVQTCLLWGECYNYTVNRWYVVLYTWIMILAVLGSFARWWNKSNAVCDYMSKSSFGLYLFHYVPLVYGAYAVTTWFHLPVLLEYLLVLIASGAAAVLLYELIRRIPLLNVLFGLKKKSS